MEEEKIYYVYKWFLKDTNEVFYIGKGIGDRYKQTYGRNQIFKEYYKDKANCDKAIIETFTDEQAALDREHELILEYWSKGQAKANIDDGGHSGKHFPWTPQMRQYLSEYNPMKNPEIAKRSAEHNKRPVEINYVVYDSVAAASKALGATPSRIGEWCKRGYTGQHQPARYCDEEYKPFATQRYKHPTAIVSKAVIVDDQYLFESLQEAAEFIGGNAQSLGRVLNKNRTTFKGHTCKYADQQPSQMKNLVQSNLEGSETRE